LIVNVIKIQLGKDKNLCNSFYIGRLNGSDFGVILKEVSDFKFLLDQLVIALKKGLEDYQSQIKFKLPMAANYFKPAEKRGEVFARIDDLLAQAELESGISLCFNDNYDLTSSPGNELVGGEQWKKALDSILDAKQLSFGQFQVENLDGSHLHHEAMMRIHLDGKLISAGVFIPWVRRLKLMARFELALLEALVAKLYEQPDLKLAINLSLETLHDSQISLSLIRLMESNSEIAPRLSIEFNEQEVSNDVELVKVFCQGVQPTGCRLGIDNAGVNFAKVTSLHELGLDYLKLSPSFSHDIANKTENLDFVRGITTLAHSIGLHIIATGVKEGYDPVKLKEVGVDGVTGPGVK
jgi:EAL domain-containing protein (putative c-di-GMP-specific phosphodiesterase class I)